VELQEDRDPETEQRQQIDNELDDVPRLIEPTED
jgi:hypothetical protein